MLVRISEESPKSSSFALTHDPDSSFTSVATVRNEAFDEQFKEQIHYRPTGILPPAVRYLSPDHSVVMWERKPCYVTFQYTQQMQNEIQADARSSKILRLPVPWQRYVILLSPENQIANVFMFFADREITSFQDDPLYVAPILNFYQNSRLCPASYNSQPDYERSIVGAMEAVHHMIWSSGFNWDTTLAISMLKNLEAKYNPLKINLQDPVKMYRMWAAQSLETVMAWKWYPVYSGIQQFLDSNDLYHNYTGSAHDLLVNMVLSAQDAS
jgi:hypothetical protein